MLTVSTYHYIREDFKAPYPSIFGLTPFAFENQLQLLRETGTFIHPEELIKKADAILDSKENFILVTFDDGLKEQFELAKPVLDKLEIPALFFVNSVNYIEKEVTLVHKIHLLRSQIAPSDLLCIFAESGEKSDFQLTTTQKEKAEQHYNYDDSESAHLKYLLNFKLTASQLSILINKLFDKYFTESDAVKALYMTEKQLITLAEKGMLGSHTHNHLALALQEPAVIKKELSQTKEFLEQLTQTKIQCVSYPYGNKESCAAPVPEIAMKAGYVLGFSTERGINFGNEDKLLLKRFDCNDLPGGKNYLVK
jgi:peptidoglycan/xylan/chitin deacetylase (PgdA/CDA1 family)